MLCLRVLGGAFWGFPVLSTSRSGCGCLFTCVHTPRAVLLVCFTVCSFTEFTIETNKGRNLKSKRVPRLKCPASVPMMSPVGPCDRQHSSLGSQFHVRLFIALRLSLNKAVFPTASSCVIPTLFLGTGCPLRATGPRLRYVASSARWEAYRTQDRRQILLRMLGVRNRSDTGGLVCAASSSSCVVDLKTFNDSNSTPVSRHSAVGGGQGGPSPLCLRKIRPHGCTDRGKRLGKGSQGAQEALRKLWSHQDIRHEIRRGCTTSETVCMLDIQVGEGSEAGTRVVAQSPTDARWTGKTWELSVGLGWLSFAHTVCLRRKEHFLRVYVGFSLSLRWKHRRP